MLCVNLSNLIPKAVVTFWLQKGSRRWQPDRHRPFSNCTTCSHPHHGCTAFGCLAGIWRVYQCSQVSWRTDNRRNNEISLNRIVNRVCNGHTLDFCQKLLQPKYLKKKKCSLGPHLQKWEKYFSTVKPEWIMLRKVGSLAVGNWFHLHTAHGQ